VAVYRTFADGLTTGRGRFSVTRRRPARPAPVGAVHAAAPSDASTLCGIDLDGLAEFGRSRYPYERFPAGRRCPVCDTAAGHPSDAASRPA
jgi:hypothetical protein